MHSSGQKDVRIIIALPSVSNAIKALEEEFGVNLFYRNNNKLTLTPEGEIFYKQAEELLAHADSVASEFHELRKKITPIRIGMPPMLGSIYLPDMYLSLWREFPEVDFHLYEYGSVKACEQVLEEKLDLAIVNVEPIGAFLYRSMVETYPDIIGIPVFPSIEQRIGVIWRKGKYQNAITEKVIKYLKNY